MTGKTGAREFYDFEKALHERLLEAEREIVGEVMAASDVEADAIEIAAAFTGECSEASRRT